MLESAAHKFVSKILRTRDFKDVYLFARLSSVLDGARTTSLELFLFSFFQYIHPRDYQKGEGGVQRRVH